MQVIWHEFKVATQLDDQAGHVTNRLMCSRYGLSRRNGILAQHFGADFADPSIGAWGSACARFLRGFLKPVEEKRRDGHPFDQFRGESRANTAFVEKGCMKLGVLSEIRLPTR